MLAYVYGKYHFTFFLNYFNTGQLCFSFLLMIFDIYFNVSGCWYSLVCLPIRKEAKMTFMPIYMSRHTTNRYYVTFMSRCAHNSVFKVLLLLLSFYWLLFSFIIAHMHFISFFSICMYPHEGYQILHFSSSFVSFKGGKRESNAQVRSVVMAHLCHFFYVSLKNALCANSNAMLACTL